MSYEHKYGIVLLFNLIFKKYALVFIVAYVTRHNGIAIPFKYSDKEEGSWQRINLWSYAMGK